MRLVTTAMKAFLTRYPVATYFVLTFAISWGGVLLVIGGPAGMTGMKAQDNPLFPLAFLAMVAGLPAVRVLMVWVYDRTESLCVAMLMHVSITACTLIFTPQATGPSLLAYGVAFAAAVWLALAVISVANSGPLSRPLRRTTWA